MTANANPAHKLIGASGLILATILNFGCSSDDADGQELFNELCATNCHGIDNLGTTGSATSAGPVDNPDLQSIKIAIRDILVMDRPDITRLRDDEIRVIADYIVLELDSVK